MGLNWNRINSSAGRATRRASDECPVTTKTIREGKFRIGSKVASAAFGIGEVLSSEPGQSGKTVVKFSIGEKKLINDRLEKCDP